MLAEREGFEPPIPVKVYTLSRRAPSATRPSLRAVNFISFYQGSRWLKSLSARLNDSVFLSSLCVRSSCGVLLRKWLSPTRLHPAGSNPHPLCHLLSILRWDSERRYPGGHTLCALTLYSRLPGGKLPGQFRHDILLVAGKSICDFDGSRRYQVAAAQYAAHGHGIDKVGVCPTLGVCANFCSHPDLQAGRQIHPDHPAPRR